MSADITELGEKYGYRPPVDQLLTLGDVREGPRFDYLSLGLGPDDVPDLIRMATDDALWWSGEDNVEVWSAIHAWRALGELRAEAAIEPLVALLAKPDPDDFDEWVGEELPEIFAQIGPAAIPALATYLRAPGHGMWSRGAAGSALQKIAEAHPETRDEVITIISTVVDDVTTRPRPPSEDDLILNGNLIYSLSELKATEVMPIVERAFNANRVDLSMAGDLEDFQIRVGVRTERETPARNYVAESLRARGIDLSPILGYDPDPYPDADDYEGDDADFDDLQLPPLPAPGSAVQRAAAQRKAKTKRKIAKQSRKQNRKKK